MKILFKHDGVLPVKRYGGTERIIYWLMKHLVKLGHEVVLIGNPKSEVEKDGIKLIKNNLVKDWRTLIPSDIDLIHLFYSPHLEMDFPLLVTIEGNGIPGEEFHINTVFVSQNHAQNHSGHEFVYNGLDFDEYPYHPKKDKAWKDFLFLAKANWKVKNLNHCIKACKNAKKNLHIAGGKKFSFSSKIKSYGMVNQEKKRELLGLVDALLWPVRWHEPFGIAIIEAFAFGVPVIGSPYGSLKELITKETGFICNNFSEFKDRIATSHQFNSDQIRHMVESKYSVAVMTEKYLDYYKRVIRGENLNPQRPHYVGTIHPEELLAF
ncbi:MAG: hypothetical protein A2381_07730 [Bdellovibrionales bacterium RIFOXYB1_FULL_37_110]|nr:MAG: hypothetical protein A2181_04495 [Bdellovibrionales bacterium RIFOXYA1_FULL_38_20]OFZ52495.1 MAG: hypothetical protein A2417_00450 [Bdellovibrionales bacterium RIFOXYC1_FULL_37_79]OFZ59697.1 MAG: hypothetical protein A2381_07730 [Bdellovibrionales bacterium RIFOXYB1_FULL_37_110]OFZ62624.1 MAG: hypothetical protein A2577_12050 [Bdellovibrionales bacterium RIFOXYD1_FULL_36_51]